MRFGMSFRRPTRQKVGPLLMLHVHVLVLFFVVVIYFVDPHLFVQSSLIWLSVGVADTIEG